MHCCSPKISLRHLWCPQAPRGELDKMVVGEGLFKGGQIHSQPQRLNRDGFQYNRIGPGNPEQI